MEVQDQESLGRWDRLGSRDAISRAKAMENICQDVMRQVEAIRPIPSLALSPPASGSPPKSDLNDILAHLLMLSKRCPYDDVKERCVRLLQGVQKAQLYMDEEGEKDQLLNQGTSVKYHVSLLVSERRCVTVTIQPGRLFKHAVITLNSFPSSYK
ncbi:hypothetical protein PFLUV_G00213950 [Perca fluviatilis]|uniref:Uncharacterized protein n=1 Tax=Perca fluviatilis TaxID=8168 RepID=A0A6A5E2V2_PERFL|nr:hypothetical protein PFLUV_G00213950 [Perca fluviatilis]